MASSRKSAAAVLELARGGRDRENRCTRQQQPSHPPRKSVNSAECSLVSACHFGGKSAKYVHHVHFVHFPITPFSISFLTLTYVFLDREGWLGVGGHTHMQMDRKLGSWRVINVGSVGAPMDVKGQAGWGLFTFENGEVHVELRRVPFDVEDVIAELSAVGYPSVEWTAGRLRA